MILLDTNAVLFLISKHRRAQVLAPYAGQLAFCPIVLLELKSLQEVGRGFFIGKDPARAIDADPRWNVDRPPLEAVIAHALPLDWTRDPFDRLIAAHALYRGWKLATSDMSILRHLPPPCVLAL